MKHKTHEVKTMSDIIDVVHGQKSCMALSILWNNDSLSSDIESHAVFSPSPASWGIILRFGNFCAGGQSASTGQRSPVSGFSRLA